MISSGLSEIDFILRDYVDSDYSQVAGLWDKTGLSNKARGDNSGIINDSISIGGRLLILEDKIKMLVIGTSWMTFDGRRIHLHHFGILPEYQGKGLSKILLEGSLRHVKDKGYQVKIEVQKTNKRAIALYEKYGFKPLGNYDIYIIRNINET